MKQVDCVFTGLSAVPDALTDLSKTCTNVTLQASLSACIQGRCSYTEQARTEPHCPAPIHS